MSDTKSFWTTLPGILSGIAAVIGAIVSLLLVLMQLNIIDPLPNGSSTESSKEPTPTPPKLSTNPLPEKVEGLEGQVFDLTTTINEKEEELTKIPLPAGLLPELEDHKKEFEKSILEFNQMLEAKRQKLDELRGSEYPDPDVRARIQQLEGEAIPDLKVGKRYVEEELNKVAEEIQKARRKQELEETLYEHREKRQVLQNQLDYLTMPKEPKP